jgi:hypothetical protein
VLGPTDLEIRDGRIRFRRAPCLGKHCIHSGWLASEGDSRLACRTALRSRL